MSIIVHRVSQQQARYTPAGGRERCGACRFYVSPRFCGKVIGPVSPMGWCGYFSQQVVSQFGGGQVVSAGGPSMDLSFMGAPLDPRITFSRASTATYTDASGVIQTAATNAPRWDYANGVLRGLLIEEQRTNVLLQSSNYTDVVWSKVGSATSPVVTANQTTAPDGTLSASRIVFVAVPSFAYCVLTQPVAAGSYTASIWLKGSVGGEQTNIELTNNGTNQSFLRVTLTTQWQRFTLTASFTGAGIFTLGGNGNNPGQTPTTAMTIYAWGGQVEQGGFGTSYIPTTGSASTRTQDVCAIPSANMTPWYASPGGSWMAEFICFVPSPANARVIGEPTSGGGGRSVLFVNGAVFPAIQYDQIAGLGTANTTVANAIVKAASTWAVGQAKICLNGGAVASLGTLTNGYNYAAVGIKLLTVDTITGSADSMTGAIRRVRYWPRVLSDAEMQQVTA